VLGQCERRWFVSLQVVATLTTIEVWGRLKLSRMLVGVAVGTALELDLEQCVFALGDVAPRALDHGVAPFQGIGGCGVVFHGERGWLESVDSVAGSALAAVGALSKLALVRVWLVAVHALLESQGLFEISTRVALRTLHRGMLAEQRIFGFRVVETLIDRLGRHPLPSAGVVARLAALGEASVMRIGVTIGAFTERDSRVASFIVRSGRMTFLAGDLRVQTSQGIAGPGVVELAYADGFPIVVGMALKTILT
jgi:hypothetical protein